MDENSCTIYVGNFFTLEWSFAERGYSHPYEYFLSPEKQHGRKFFFFVKRVGDLGKISDKTKFRDEGDKIFEFKPQPDRYLCFFITGKKIIITNAFTKKSKKLPKTEKLKSIKCRENYLARKKDGKNENDI